MASDENAVLPQLDFSPREGGEMLFVSHLRLDNTSHFPKLLLSQLPCFPSGRLAAGKASPRTSVSQCNGICHLLD